MNQHDFQPIFALYPSIIRQMPTTFSAQEFILKLAHENQALYVIALYDYIQDGNTNPFQIVHGILAKHLRAFPELVGYIDEVDSTDIFSQPERCSRWRKL